MRRRWRPGGSRRRWASRRGREGGGWRTVGQRGREWLKLRMSCGQIKLELTHPAARLTGNAIAGGLFGLKVGLTGVACLRASTLSLARLRTTGAAGEPRSFGKLPLRQPVTPGGVSTGRLDTGPNGDPNDGLAAPASGGRKASVGEG